MRGKLTLSKNKSENYGNVDVGFQRRLFTDSVYFYEIQSYNNKNNRIDFRKLMSI